VNGARDGSSNKGALVRTIAEAFVAHAQLQPDALFSTFIQGSATTRITFGELFARSSAYARAYANLGVKPGDVVIIILKHSPHLFYSFLGAILAGAIPSFIPFPSPKQRADLYWDDHDRLFARIKPQALVTYSENLAAARAHIRNFGLATIVADDEILTTSGPDVLHQGKPDDVACLQHSSGTTGLKKGVMLTNRAILVHHDAYREAIGFGNEDSIASWLPLYHDMGFVACFLGSLLQGTHLVLLDPFEWVMRPRMLLDAIAQHRTTLCWLPNFAFSHLVNGVREGDRWDLSSIRAFINCSEPCKSGTFERFLNRFSASGVSPEKLQVCYAMAENVFAVTQTPLSHLAKALHTDEAQHELLSCGPPVDGVEIRVLDPTTRERLPAGRIGEICIRGPFLFNGYYRQPEKTAERLQDGWYTTGDMGLIHEDELYISGRVDDMLIVNGRNYYAHELEALLAEVDGIIPGRSVAIGVDDDFSGATAVVVLAECDDLRGARRVAAAAKSAVLERTGLALHSFVPIERGGLVKTTSGKLSRTKNKELYLLGRFKVGTKS
jgi:acyl-CoA synthetase (AMP-forming)/AMP-acid ligase II